MGDNNHSFRRQGQGISSNRAEPVFCAVCGVELDSGNVSERASNVCKDCMLRLEF
jgi:NMD protein affecting ribosome stability and mRNA decay